MQHYKKEHFLIDNGQSGSRIVLGMPAMLKSCQMVRVMATPLWGRDMASIRNRIRSSPIFIAFVESSHAWWGENIYKSFSWNCGSKYSWPLATRENKNGAMIWDQLGILRSNYAFVESSPAQRGGNTYEIYFSNFGCLCCQSIQSHLELWHGFN